MYIEKCFFTLTRGLWTSGRY